MGIPLHDSLRRPSTLAQEVDNEPAPTSSNTIPSLVSPSTLALLARSLPPDRLRIFLTSLFRHLGYARADNLMAISHILLSSLDTQERHTSPYFTGRPTTPAPDDDVEPGEIMAQTEPGAEGRSMTDEQIEKALSDGTPFQLIPALTLPRDSSMTSERPNPTVRWVWRSMTDHQRGFRSSPSGIPSFMTRPLTEPPTSLSLRNTSENVLSLLARDIEDTIFQTLTSELARLATTARAARNRNLGDPTTE